MYIGLGGSCTSGMIDRSLKLYNISLQFDFIRIKFSSIIKFIDNNFDDFLPLKNTPPNDIRNDNKLLIYFMKTHTFYHHDLLDNNIYEAFIRRINRFLDLLKNKKEIIFYRIITSEYIKDEINLLNDFYNLLSNNYPNLLFRIIFIGSVYGSSLDNIYYKNIDNISSIFYIPVLKNNNLDHITDYSAKCIEFIRLNNFIDKKIKININTFEYIEDDFEEILKNQLFLDNYI